MNSFPIMQPNTAGVVEPAHVSDSVPETPAVSHGWHAVVAGSLIGGSDPGGPDDDGGGSLDELLDDDGGSEELLDELLGIGRAGNPICSTVFRYGSSTTPGTRSQASISVACVVQVNRATSTPRL